MTIIVKEKKVSVTSITSYEKQNVPHLVHSDTIKSGADHEPEDKYYYVHIVFMLMGLMHFLPMSFFVTANAYWMYKFRNVSAEITDTDERTALQTHFTPGCSISNCIPGLVCIWMSTIFGYKIKARRRVLVSLSILSACFIGATAFVEINTDSWQTLFFVITMISMVLINASNAVIEVAVLVILSKFPQHYMKVYLLGQGFAAIFNSILQIATLAIGTSTIASALLYFICGTLVMVVSLVLYYFTKFNSCYNYHAKSIVENTKRDLLPFSEVKDMLKVVWPSIVTMGLLQMTQSPAHHAITSLVVPEHYGDGSEWNDKYFVPVITFLYGDILTLLGRIAASKINKTFRGSFLNGFLFIRMLIFLPLIYLCNAQPRNHLPVLFPHDWEYIIILGVFTFTTGYFYNMVFLDIGKYNKVKPEKVEAAFMVFMSVSSVVGALISPISLFSVDLL
ncbi:hypothetical protein NQ318_007587 [Aromia moschata]|uniref:Equilibrative nucleoside transporter 3 n=1 Tax=Aromia moschata TaxID=1265417 RepID=A0AAV8YAV3_9CUCU|nr:hypothetical protein NQ318_007587 [Aromia moschata]